MESKVIFVDKELKEAFEGLKTEDGRLFLTKY